MTRYSLAFLLAATSLNAVAAVLTFDDIPSMVIPLPNGYGGFNWNGGGDGIYSFGKDLLPGSGYDLGTVSGDITVFNAYGSSGNAIDWAGTGTFDFVGAYWTSASFPQQLSFSGYNNGALLYSSASYEIDTQGPLWIELNWTGIDRLVIENTNWQWAMDNFTFNVDQIAQIPEPASLVLLGLGLAGLAAFRRHTTRGPWFPCGLPITVSRPSFPSRPTRAATS